MGGAATFAEATMSRPGILQLLRSAFSGNCPHCGSSRVFRSQSHISIYRFLLLARARCHRCNRTFFVFRWNATDPRKMKIEESE